MVALPPSSTLQATGAARRHCQRRCLPLTSTFDDDEIRFWIAHPARGSIIQNESTGGSWAKEHRYPDPRRHRSFYSWPALMIFSRVPVEFALMALWHAWIRFVLCVPMRRRAARWIIRLT